MWGEVYRSLKKAIIEPQEEVRKIEVLKPQVFHVSTGTEEHFLSVNMNAVYE